jgi:hypothetical protein
MCAAARFRSRRSGTICGQPRMYPASISLFRSKGRQAAVSGFCSALRPREDPGLPIPIMRSRAGGFGGGWPKLMQGRWRRYRQLNSGRYPVRRTRGCWPGATALSRVRDTKSPGPGTCDVRPLAEGVERDTETFGLALVPVPISVCSPCPAPPGAERLFGRSRSGGSNKCGISTTGFGAWQRTSCSGCGR